MLRFSKLLTSKFYFIILYFDYEKMFYMNYLFLQNKSISTYVLDITLLINAYFLS